jgi:hypothetical protein
MRESPARRVFPLKAGIQLFLIRCGGDFHLFPSSHFFRVFYPRDVILPFVFKVLEEFYEHIGKRMSVAL